MPWLIGGGVLLALLLGSNSSTAAPLYPSYAPTPTPPPQPQPPNQSAYQPPPPSLQAHLATVLSQPTAPKAQVTVTIPSSQDTVTQSVFSSPPYGSKPGHNQFQWWINHYTGSDYTNGETVSQHDVDDAVHNAIHTGTLNDVFMLQGFATQLLGEGAADEADWNLLKNFINSLQTDAIAPFVELYANVKSWPPANITNNAQSAPDKAAVAALQNAIAGVKAHGSVADCKNFGTLLIGFDYLGTWDSAGAALIAYANTPAFKAAAAKRAAPPPPVTHTAPAVRPPQPRALAVTPFPLAHPEDAAPSEPSAPAPPEAAGLPAGFTWQDQGNTTPIDTSLVVGETVQATIVGPAGHQFEVAGLAQAGPTPDTVTLYVAASATWPKAIGPIPIPLSYVIPVAPLAGSDEPTPDAGDDGGGP